MYNISFLLLSHVCYLAMPTIIGAEPTIGVRVCPRSHTHSYLFIIIIYLFATCSVLYIVCNQGFSPPPPYQSNRKNAKRINKLKAS